MENKVLTFDFEEIVEDPIAVGQALTKACNHHTSRYLVRGVFAQNGLVRFFLEVCPSAMSGYRRYILDETVVENEQTVISVVNQRWQGGFSTVGFFCVYESLFGLFENCEEIAE